MATSDILGLFMSPEQYQAQQLAQQQAAEQQRAINFANLDPRQQAVYGTFLGSQQLARGLGGLLGVQDPQLQRIRQREEIMRSINPADMASLTAGIQRASQMGDQELALSLTDFMNKQGSEMALAQQRKAQAERERVQGLPSQIAISREIGILQTNLDELKKTPETPERNRGIAILQSQLDNLVKQGPAGIQEAARINQITQELANLDPTNAEDKPKYDALVAERMRLERQAKVKSGDKLSQLQDLYEKRKEAVASFGADSQDVQIIDRLINSLAPEKGDKTFESIVKSERIGTLTDELATLKDAGKENTPEYRRKSAELKSLQGETGGKQFESLVLADNIVQLRKQIRDAKDPADPVVLEAKDRLAVLEQQLKKDKPNITVVGEVKSGADKGKAVYVDENNDQQFVYDVDKTGKQVRKPFVGDVDRITSQVTATASSSAPGIKAFQEKLGALDAKDVESARANRDNSIAALNTLNELSRLNQQGVTSGAFADGRIGAVNLLNTLGLVSRNDVATLANSQTFNKVAGDLVLATLGGKLGAGFSNEDRKFIASLVPQLETSREARQKLISFMMKKNQLIIDEADRLETYARENNGLKGFRPKIPIVNAPAPGTVQAMTDAELRAAIDKAKQKGK